MLRLTRPWTVIKNYHRVRIIGAPIFQVTGLNLKRAPACPPIIGINLALPVKESVTFRSHLGKNVRSGVPCRFPFELVDNVVRRLLKLMFRLGIWKCAF